MKIVADADIPYVKEAFIEFGRVVAVPWREIKRDILKDAAMLIVRSVTRVDGDLLQGTPVKFVATVSAGTDHIDRPYLEKQGIGFANAPGSNANAVAEYILSALMHIAGIKKIELHNCTIGIIGVGNVGSRVFKVAETLGMKCLLHDPPKKRLTNSAMYLPLDTVLRESDIITLHVPLNRGGNDNTYHMVDGDFVTTMKDGALLINTSRGKVVDEKQFCETAPQTLKGIAIDVWDNEPRINIELLRIADIATPHIAGYSYDGKIQGIGMVYDSACAFFFKNKKWNIASIINNLKGGTIDISTSKNPMNAAINKAYPILNDDTNLRKILEVPKNEQESFFDTLRKNYPKRLEFSHYTLNTASMKEKEKEMLANIGFHCR